MMKQVVINPDLMYPFYLEIQNDKMNDFRNLIAKIVKGGGHPHMTKKYDAERSTVWSNILEMFRVCCQSTPSERWSIKEVIKEVNGGNDRSVGYQMSIS